MALIDQALLTISDMETFLGLTPGAQDDELEFAINAASQLILTHIDRDLKKETITDEIHKGFGNKVLRVKRPPIDEAEDIVITYDGVELDDSEYEVQDAEAGILYKITGSWVWTAATVPNSTYDPYPGSERGLYKVSYTGGYTLTGDSPAPLLPADLKLAAKQLAASNFYGLDRDPDLKSEKLLSAAYTYGRGDEGAYGLPASVAGILAAYKVYV